MVNLKIKINVFRDSIGLQLFDRWYAYKQSLNLQKFQTNVQVEFGLPEPDAINIAFSYLPKKSFINFDLYDFVFFDNAGESLTVATDYISQELVHDKAFFLCGGFLTDDHPLVSKIIPFNHNIRLMHDCMTRGFYPQYYHRLRCSYKPNKNMIFINGANRSWRRYFIDSLLQSNVSVDIKSSLGNLVIETPQCAFEDPYDSVFREQLNNLYSNATIQDYDYYNKNVKIGIDEKFGQIPIGCFLIEEYYQYHCVIFPETSWINCEHFATEKIYKCFVAGSIPFPIGGAKTHQQYNAHGYQTAWNLLPKQLQSFDDELDHEKRYQLIVEAIAWLDNNNKIFESEQANSLRDQNQINFFKNTLDVVSVQKLDQVLRQSKKYCE